MHKVDLDLQVLFHNNLSNIFTYFRTTDVMRNIFKLHELFY